MTRLEPEWRELAPRSNATSVFTSPTWARIWWEEFGGGEREQLLLALRDGGRLYGVAPLMREADRITFCGDSAICDYMDIVVATGKEEEAAEALFRALAEDSWQELVLWAMPDSSPNLRSLTNAARSMGYSVDLELEDVCPGVSLLDGWDQYLATLTRKDRHELRRKLRRLQAAGDVFLERLLDADEIAGAMDDFFRLHIMSRTDKAAFMTPQMQQFFRRVVAALALEGKARLYFLRLNGVRVAAVICFAEETEHLLYNSGYDPAYASVSVGLLSKTMALQQAIDEGKQYFDFLRGAEAYKYDLGATDRKVYRCTVRRG